MKLGKWKDLGSAEYYAGMLSGVGVGIFVASALLAPQHRTLSFGAFVFAFGCILAGSTLATTARRRRLQKEEQRHDLEQKRVS